jgi:hypothetical protein
MNNIKKFAMATLFVLILLVSGCIEKSVIISDKNVAQVEQSTVDSEIGKTEDKIGGSNGIESAKPEYKVEFEYIDNLDELEIEDLNSDSIRKVILQLPNKWNARKATYKVVDDFEFKEEKNKGIRKSSIV